MAEALRAATTCWISTADEPLRISPPAEANAMEESTEAGFAVRAGEIEPVLLQALRQRLVAKTRKASVWLRSMLIGVDVLKITRIPLSLIG